MSAGLSRTFASLSVPNYRRYFTGQVVSITGNWMQNVAEMWLVVQLTGNGVSVGLTAALQFLPIMLLGAWGGLLADRVSKRRLLTITQSLMALPALTLWLLTVHGSTVPAAATIHRVSAGSAIRVCVTIRSDRFGNRSASRPPSVPKRRNGRNWSAEVTPTAIPLPVSDRISHISATICIQLPLSDTS